MTLDARQMFGAARADGARPSRITPRSSLALVEDGAPPSASVAPSLARRPVNVARTIFHVLSGVVALALVRLLPTRLSLIGASAVFAIFAWTSELVRRRSPSANARLMRVFGPVAHAHEWHEVNSATWYATALVLMATLLPLDAASAGVVVLACADPVAGIVGRRFGRRRFASGRSLEGALAFVVTGALAAYAWMAATGAYADVRLALAVVAGVAGACIELLVTRLDDNFAIPVGTGLAVAAAAAMLA